MYLCVGLTGAASFRHPTTPTRESQRKPPAYSSSSSQSLTGVLCRPSTRTANGDVSFVHAAGQVADYPSLSRLLP